MVIAVNTRLLLKGKLEGLGRFSYETLKRITSAHPEHQFIFIFDRKFDEEFIFSSNITPVVAHPQSRHPLLWYLYFDWGIPMILRKHKPDLFLSPDGWLSLRTNTPSLAVIHDLNFLHKPEWVDTLPKLYYNYFFPKFAKKAKRVATVSEFSKDDICNRLNVPKENIDVVYNGVNESFVSISENAKLEIKKKYSHSKDYFLFVGLVHPRKNLTNIIKAFENFKKQSGSEKKLLVAGSRKYWTKDTMMAFENSAYKDDIIFLNRVESNELHKITASASCLVYASLFEGFGIPILEAFNCEVPVITSNITSMPEVAGDAALLVDPYSINSITDAMVKISHEKNLPGNLIEKGRIQKQKFSWDMSAKLLWNSIEKCLEEK